MVGAARGAIAAPEPAPRPAVRAAQPMVRVASRPRRPPPPRMVVVPRRPTLALVVSWLDRNFNSQLVRARERALSAAGTVRALTTLASLADRIDKHLESKAVGATPDAVWKRTLSTITEHPLLVLRQGLAADGGLASEPPRTRNVAVVGS